jgi:hypothetical protein
MSRYQTYAGTQSTRDEGGNGPQMLYEEYNEWWGLEQSFLGLKGVCRVAVRDG